MQVPLDSKATAPARYRVRLHFAELKCDRAGERVFDIRVQGKVRWRTFDPFAAAGGRLRAVVLKARGVRAQRELVIEFAPRAGAPLLAGLEILREDAR